jgi:hypothetical protein
MPKRTRASTATTAAQAENLTNLLRARGGYEHVSVRAERGHLVIYSDDSSVARLTPLERGTYGLSFQRHTGRWEAMPFTGSLDEMADTVVDTLAPYLESYGTTDRNSGSDH